MVNEFVALRFWIVVLESLQLVVGIRVEVRCHEHD